MIECPGNEETIHVANWFLYSAEVDIGDLILQARAAVMIRTRNHPQLADDDQDELMKEQFAELLESEFESIADDFGTDCVTTGGPSMCDFLDGFWFYSDTHNSLIGPLLRQVCAKVCFVTVAKLVLAHYEQPALKLPTGQRFGN